MTRYDLLIVMLLRPWKSKTRDSFQKAKPLTKKGTVYKKICVCKKVPVGDVTIET